jgi:hypothetical protein
MPISLSSDSTLCDQAPCLASLDPEWGQLDPSFGPAWCRPEGVVRRMGHRHRACRWIVHSHELHYMDRNGTLKNISQIFHHYFDRLVYLVIKFIIRI